MLLLLAGAGQGVLAGGSSLKTLEGLVGRWVDLQGQADAEQRAWEAQAAQWRQDMALLAVEQERLAAALETLEEAGESHQERGAALLERRALLTAVLADVDVALAHLQPMLDTVCTRLPAALLSAELKAALEARPSAGDAAGTVGRLQRALGALKILEDMQNGIHTSREMVALPGGDVREMETLYIGLVGGFGVTSDGRVAAVGRSGESGWHWTSTALPGAEIRRLLRMANQEEPPALVLFPVAVGLETTGWQKTTEDGQ